MRARTIQNDVEYNQWLGGNDILNWFNEIRKECESKLEFSLTTGKDGELIETLIIRSKSRVVRVNVGDFLVLEVNKELCSFNEEMFNRKYERI